MKKAFYGLFSIIGVLLFGVVGCRVPPDANPVESTTEPKSIESIRTAIESTIGSKTMNCFVSFDVKKDIFYAFMENPSMDVLLHGEGTSIGIFSNSSNGTIQFEGISGSEINSVEAPAGVFRLGDSTPVHESLLDFAGDNAEVAKYLIQHDVMGGIENLAVISLPSIPVVIWVQVGQENYFITLDDQYYEDCIDIHKTTYVYRLYTQEEYVNKFGMKTGSLFVNGKEVTVKNPIKIYFDYAELPLTTVLENLGGNVKWQNDNIATISFKGKKYKLDMEKISVIKVGRKLDNLIMPITGGYRFYETVDRELILDSNMIQQVLKQMGAEISIAIDRSQFVVLINSSE